jgi:hypothetical protein
MAATLAVVGGGAWYLREPLLSLTPTHKGDSSSAQDVAGTASRNEGSAPARRSDPYVAAIARPQKPKDAWARAKELRARADGYSTEEIEQLCWFMENIVELDGLPADEGDELKNEIMNRLGEQAPVERFATMLLQVQGDERQSPVMRAYAVQHLSAWYDRFTDVDAVQKALWERSQDATGVAGPTALLALRRLEGSGKLRPDDRQRLQNISREILHTPAAGESVRMAALEILRQSRDPEALQAARSIVTGNHSVALLITALGAVGELGGVNDLQFLSQSPLLDQPAVATTLQHTLETLKTKTEL